MEYLQRISQSNRNNIIITGVKMLLRNRFNRVCIPIKILICHDACCVIKFVRTTFNILLIILMMQICLYVITGSYCMNKSSYAEMKAYLVENCRKTARNMWTDNNYEEGNIHRRSKTGNKKWNKYHFKNVAKELNRAPKIAMHKNLMVPAAHTFPKHIFQKFNVSNENRDRL